MNLSTFFWLNALCSSSDPDSKKNETISESDPDHSEDVDFSGWDEAMERISSPLGILSDLIFFMILLFLYVIFCCIRKYL